MPLIVEDTTDGKYIGQVFPIDPHNPPAEVEAPDGSVFDPESWTDLGGGKWRIRNAHYTVIAREVN